MLKDWAQKNKDTNELAKRLYNEELAKFTTTESMSTLEYLAFEKQKKTEIETKSERPQKSENLVIYSQSQEQSKSATSEKISKAEVNDKPNTNEWGGTWKEIHDDPYSVDVSISCCNLKFTAQKYTLMVNFVYAIMVDIMLSLRNG